MLHWLDRILHYGLTKPETPAIILIDRVVTFGMLRAAILRCAKRLATLELPRDAPIGVMLESPVRVITISLALHRLGLSSMPLEQRQSGLSQISLSALLSDQGAKVDIKAGTRRIEVGDAWFVEDVADGKQLPPPRSDPEWASRFALTSGSTGQPKLVAYSHGYFSDHVNSKIMNDVLHCRQVAMFLPGLSSNYGFSSNCAGLVAGRTLCFAESPAHAVRIIDLYRVDTLGVSPEQLLGMVLAARRSGAQLLSLQTVLCGGGVVSRTLLEQSQAYLCRNVIFTYGASEMGRVAIANAAEVKARPGLVGYPQPGVGVQIRAAGGTVLGANEIGEIAIGKSLLPRTTVVEGEGREWVLTGDIGWLDEEGRLHVCGRASDDAVASKGVSAVREAEDIAKLEHDVDDAAAVEIAEAAGTSDKRAVWLAVSGTKAVNSAVIEAQMRERGIDCAVRSFGVPAIPRGANGKVQRGPLKAMLQAQAVAIVRS